jgi:tetratricopeptide (TPR) repeat protein
MHLNPIWTWSSALAAALLWTLGVWWFRRTTRAWGRESQWHMAHSETMTWAWSEARMLEVMERFPNSAEPAIAYASFAFERKDVEETLRRYQEAIRRDPTDIRAYLYPARVLRDNGRLDEAEALLRVARQRFRSNQQVHEDLAWIAQRRNDWPEMARRWAAVRKRFPMSEVAYREGAAALRMAGCTADADALLAKAAARFPAEAGANSAAG